MWVYGQTEVQKDLVTAAHARGQQVVYEITDTALHDLGSDHPCVTFTDAGRRPQRLEADVVVGCDGSFGPSRAAVPDAVRRTWERTYPYSWLGILADVAPSTDELIYAWHPDGFALHSMRSADVSRFYLQVPNDTDLADWSDDRIWDALATRLGDGQHGWQLTTGPITDKSVLPMRSFVQEPMRHGRLFLAGDAAHIVPPTGAKGLNLAVADVALLAPALVAWLRRGDARLADAYSDTALRRVWRCTHFSWWMTTMLHTIDDPFDDAAPAVPAALGHLERGRRRGAGGELRGSADRVLTTGVAASGPVVGDGPADAAGGDLERADQARLGPLAARAPRCRARPRRRARGGPARRPSRRRGSSPRWWWRSRRAAPGASWRRSRPGWVIVYGVIRGRSASTAALHLGRARARAAPCRPRSRASAAASRCCSRPAPRRARRAGRRTAPRCRRARRGARSPASRRRGRGGTARPASRSPVCTGASRPRSHSRRPTTYSPAGGAGQRAPADAARRPAGARSASAARPARASSVSVSRRWCSSKAPSSASAREVTVAPGVEVLPAMAPVFH